MRAERFPPRAEWHPLGCTCRGCEPDRPSKHRLSANAIAACVLAGVGTAAALIQLFAFVTGAPGVGVIFAN